MKRIGSFYFWNTGIVCEVCRSVTGPEAPESATVVWRPSRSRPESTVASREVRGFKILMALIEIIGLDFRFDHLS